MPFAARWMGLKSVALSEVKSDREGEIVCDTPYKWDLKRNDTNELTYKTETDSQTSRMSFLPVAGGSHGGKGK